MMLDSLKRKLLMRGGLSDPATAAISAGANIFSGLLGSDAASSAAQTQANAANQANATQLAMFNTLNNQSAPYRNVGNAALYQMGNLMGLKIPQQTQAQTGQMPGITAPTNFASGNVPISSMFGGPQPAANTSNLSPLQQAQLANGGTAGFPQGQSQQMLTGGQYQSPGGPLSMIGKVAPVLSQTPGLSATAPIADFLQQTTAQSTPSDFGSLTKQFGSAADLAQWKDPGYDFRLSQGLGALQNQAGVTGGLVSGATLKGLMGYGQDMASQEYQNAFNRYNTNQTNLFNRLSSLANVGQVANGQAQTYGGNAANAISNNQTSAGAAQAAGQVGSTNALTSGINNAAGWYQLSKMPGWGTGTTNNNSGGGYFGGIGSGGGLSNNSWGASE